MSLFPNFFSKCLLKKYSKKGKELFSFFFFFAIYAKRATFFCKKVTLLFYFCAHCRKGFSSFLQQESLPKQCAQKF